MGEDLVGDPDNDRLMPAFLAKSTAGSQGGNGNGGGGSLSSAPGSPQPRNLQSRGDWWKRFSTVVHENERKEAMAEKVGGSSSARKRRMGSEWLSREEGGQKNYRIWVGLVGALIIAGIAGGRKFCDLSLSSFRVVFFFLYADEQEGQGQTQENVSTDRFLFTPLLNFISHMSINLLNISRLPLYPQDDEHDIRSAYYS